MPPRSYANQVTVSITIPDIPGHPLSGETLGLDEIARDLESISTNKNISAPAGAYQLSFTGAHRYEGRTWDDLIPTYAVARLNMWRPSVEEEACVMAGPVEAQSQAESWRQPRVTVARPISGKDFQGLLSDFKLYALLAGFGIESDAFTGIKEAMRGVLIDPELLTRNQPPHEIIAAILTRYKDSMKLGLPDDFGSVIRFDKNEMRTFDADARYPIPPLYMHSGSLWGFLMQYADPTFHELFADTHPAGDHVEVVFRPRPFTRDVRLRTDETLFDPVSMDPTVALGRSRVATIVLPEEDILDWNISRGTAEMANLFWVLPGTSLFTDKEWRALVAPEVCDTAGHPSDLNRYGVRPMEVTTPYWPVGLDDLNDEDKRQETAEAAVPFMGKWAKILKAWYQYNPLLYSGSIGVTGRSSYRIGDRLVVNRASERFEFYIQGVKQTYLIPTSSFETHLSVVRGFRLGSVSAQYALERAEEDLRTVFPELG